MPGTIEGAVSLMSGQKVPTMDMADLENREKHAQKVDGVRNFLEKVYHELRDLGVSPQERAINYAATNALNVSKIFEVMINDQIQLDTIEVEQSPICKPGADCWDVKLTFLSQSTARAGQKCLSIHDRH